MKKIIISLSIIGGVAAIVTGATVSFFSDSEISRGNVFAAGAIDLKIDNESYYNGAINPSMTWEAEDLATNGRLFFNFQDLKPDDEGEDTISLHVNDNDAYSCMDLALTSNNDKSSNEPELDTGDSPEDLNDSWDGELAQNLQMFWWADDGDNVYETGENQITDGVQTVTDMFGPSHQFSVALADSAHNVWGNEGPIPGDQTVYIAKAWCFGDLSLNPVPAGQGVNPLVASGVTCDGTALGNETQTDGVTMDMAFRAYQARSVSGFLCNEEKPRTATITVIKHVINDNGGNNVVPDFHLFVDNGVVNTPVTSGTSTVVTAGDYHVGETGVSGYEGVFSGDCDEDGNITLNDGDDKTCTITNDDLPAVITLIKNVINNNTGSAGPASFTLKVDSSSVSSGNSKSVTSNALHTINEVAKTGYHFVSITGSPECPGVLGGSVNLNEGQAITCTITNDDNP